jgi:hypothetical protein
MKLIVMLIAVAAAPLAAQVRTPASDAVRCSVNYAPDRACRLTDTVAAGGVHRMVFEAGGQRLVFVGRKQTGWWAGKLNGRPAMGYERNRGSMVLSTYDLRTNLAWWYPGQAHGTY